MDKVTLDMLCLSSEAIVCLRAGRLDRANAPALAFLGQDALGKPAGDIFGDAIVQCQAQGAQICAPVMGTPCNIRSIRSDDLQLLSFRRDELPPAELGHSFLYVLHSALMNMSLALEPLRAQVEEAASHGSEKALRGITRCQFRLTRIVDHASMVLSAAEDVLHFEPIHFDLSALYSSILDGVQDVLPDVPIQRELDPGILVHADLSMMKILLLELLSNAILHGKGLSRISVRLRESGGAVILSVDDDGCGIPTRELPMVFERYKQQTSLSQMSFGPGFGLTVVRIIARMHNGTLMLESQEGRGTAVRVCLQQPVRSSLAAADQPAFCETRDLFTGLAECLPAERFDVRWLD